MDPAAVQEQPPGSARPFVGVLTRGHRSLKGSAKLVPRAMMGAVRLNESLLAGGRRLDA